MQWEGVQFWLNGNPRVQVGANDQTLLDYLRHEGLTGTKEGCASGDCGACTVLIQDEVGGSHYPANACILPIQQLQHQGVLTVEGLANAEALNPVQAALIEQHGSQCGFCTPGFVMAMAGWLSAQPEATLSDHALMAVNANSIGKSAREAISGNLCRCTGYRPILAAAYQALAHPVENRRLPDSFGAGSDVTSSPQPEVVSATAIGAFYRPENLRSLEAILRLEPGAILVAGGTDLMLEVTQKQSQFSCLVSTARIDELKQLEFFEDQAVIGAGVTLSTLKQIAESAWPQLATFLSRLGSPQIRNRGTVGGNLGTASPIGDLLPIFLAMDAEVTVGDAEGNRRCIELSEFLTGYRQTQLGPGEYILSVRVQGLEDFHRYYKVTKRQEDDIATVGVSLRLKLDGDTIIRARIAVGGVAEKACRLRAIEAQLEGVRLTPQLIETIRAAVGSQIRPLSDVRASAAYRHVLTANLLARGLTAATGLETRSVFEVEPDA